MNTREEAINEAKRILSILDSIADEDWIAEGFDPELLVVESPSGFDVNVSLITYGLQEMGLGNLAEDFLMDL